MRLLLVALVAAVTPGQIVAKLNAQRVATGIPGGIAFNAQWTTGCEHHVRYEELNGITWTHQETPGKPGFTKDGQARGRRRRSVVRERLGIRQPVREPAPVSPLRSHARHTATATVAGPNDTQTKTWHFTTA